MTAPATPAPPGPMTAPAAPAYGTIAPDHPRSTLALILGILGIVACSIVAPFALVIGRGAVKEIDAKRVATVGHSRNGKTALLAAAFDPRFAMAVPSQAGCGGTAPSRVAPDLAKPGTNGRPTAETVAVINKAFPHWFCGNFKAFNEAPDRLPFDQHELVALCAPRPVMLSNATEDQWANPTGQFDVLKGAEPVYRLVAKDGLGSETMPEVGKPLNSRLGYYIRPGKHSMTGEDWRVWLDFADRWLK